MLHGHARVVKAVKGHVKFPEGYNPQVTIWHTQVIPYLKAIYPVDTRRRFNVYKTSIRRRRIAQTSYRR